MTGPFTLFRMTRERQGDERAYGGREGGARILRLRSGQAPAGMTNFIFSLKISFSCRSF